MYAVIKSGGKQYRVREGETLKLEKLELEVGASINFDQILMVAAGDAITVGDPYVANAKIQAEVVSQGRHKKIKIVKFRRRKHSMTQRGHRQYFTEVKIIKIEH